jgi:hypothetical protein
VSCFQTQLANWEGAPDGNGVCLLWFFQQSTAVGKTKPWSKLEKEGGQEFASVKIIWLFGPLVIDQQTCQICSHTQNAQ